MSDKKRNKKYYYLNEFKKVKEGKFSWNWAAAICGWCWFVYRRVYSGLLCYLGAVLLCMFISATLLGVNDLDSIAGMKIMPGNPWISVLFGLIPSIIAGFFANEWYYSSIKSKIKNGAHLYEDYQATNSNLLILMIALLFLGQLINRVYEFGVVFTLAIGAIEIGAVVVAWKIEKDALEKNAEKLGAFPTEMSEENISKLI